MISDQIGCIASLDGLLSHQRFLAMAASICTSEDDAELREAPPSSSTSLAATMQFLYKKTSSL